MSKTLALGEFTVLGWTPPAGEFSEKDWRTALGSLNLERSNADWRLGDLWAFGESKYGDCKAMTESPDWHGPSYKSCRNAAAISRAFCEMSRRRDILSFNHHSEVAALPKTIADELLDWAACERKSTRALRKRVRVLQDPATIAKTISEQVEKWLDAKDIKSGWRLRRVANAAPELAQQVLDGKLTPTRAYEITLERTRERTRQLKEARTATAFVPTGNVVRLTNRRTPLESATALGRAMRELRIVYEDRYSSETLRRAIPQAEALQIEADVRVVIKFLNNVVRTWEMPELRVLNPQEKAR